MTLKEAELLFQAGALLTSLIKKTDSHGAWIVTLAGKHKLDPELEAARGHVRAFKRLDAAVGMLFELDFETVKVVR